MKVTAIFDIGKTNKKCYLFDQELNEVHKEYITIPEIEDEDGDPCDDLTAIVNWIRSTLDSITRSKDYQLEAINFSTYGASFVHLDENGDPLTPLYNYLKPYPKKLLKGFYDTYGDSLSISRETSSPKLEMLNSGMQLYWLKHARPEVYQKVRYSLHFPQYLSYVLTGEMYSEYTGIGCHTMLWNFSKNNYHSWVYKEGIDRVLAPIVSTDNYVEKEFKGSDVRIGIGIHDSSSALLPYIKLNKKPFLLLSTGTWSIALNPFNEEVLTKEDLEKDCLNFLRTDGKPVRVSRLFMGNEYNHQIEALAQHFNVSVDQHKLVSFDVVLHSHLKEHYQRKFAFTSVNRGGLGSPRVTAFDSFQSYKEAYHQLIMELVELQVLSIHLAIGDTPVNKLYIDGGFADNEIFVELLTREFPDMELVTTNSPLGSSLGAALLVSDLEWKDKFFNKHFRETVI